MRSRIPLTEAAYRAGLTYHQVRALVLRGALKGGRDEFGRFYVDRPDLERLVQAGRKGVASPRGRRR